MDKLNNNNLSSIEEGINFLTSRLEALEKRIQILEEKKKRALTGEFNREAGFQELKDNFKDSNPHARTDTFNVQELTLWCSYILKDNKERREVLNITEFYKRIASVKKLLQYIKEYYISFVDSKFAEDERAEELDNNARETCKKFLEYMIIIQGLNFWQSISEWGFNNHFATFYKTKHLEDKPL